jgi:hypothetical protein
VTECLKKGPKIGILDFIVFHSTPVVEFDFVAMFVTVCEEGGGGGELSKFLPLNTSTYLSDRVLQKER